MADVKLFDGTYTSFSGADAICIFNGRAIGELQAITVNVQREKGPVYVMGRSNPLSFSRGKRGIAGNLVFVMFDRDALIEEMEKVANLKGTIPQYTAAGNISPFTGLGSSSIITSPNSYTGLPLNAEFNNLPTNVQFTNMNNLTPSGLNNNPFVQLHGTQPGEFWDYEDQIPPFDITVTFANEYGDAAYMMIYRAEILNEGMGVSIDDINLERACTFVAQDISRLRRGFFTSGQASTSQPATQSSVNPGALSQL